MCIHLKFGTPKFVEFREIIFGVRLEHYTVSILLIFRHDKQKRDRPANIAFCKDISISIAAQRSRRNNPIVIDNIRLQRENFNQPPQLA